MIKKKKLKIQQNYEVQRQVHLEVKMDMEQEE